ncbi:DUF7230 family protein [Bauldia litoralis]|uniref:Uncharacterized protein n=1 Tax=Bauldia litoralis TaxID=665467 RepID=A0A1G6E5S7_9HYPH|nr:hypothetical protein [Bauldia litoralis]SDB52741.1 hypothetical protein SAMN02982931_04154 [Bauldia litoralis]
MKKPKAPKTPKEGKPPRNPFARALRDPLYKPKVAKGKDEYRRTPKHPKPPETSDGDD